MKLPIPIKSDSYIPWGHADFLRRPTLCGGRFSLNKSTSYLSFCLSLNSFCDKTTRIWDSWGPETSWSVWSQLIDHWSKSQSGFWMGSSPYSHVSQFLLKINVSLHPPFLPTHTHILSDLFFWGVLKQVVELPIHAQIRQLWKWFWSHAIQIGTWRSQGPKENRHQILSMLCAKPYKDSNFHQSRSQRH